MSAPSERRSAEHGAERLVLTAFGVTVITGLALLGVYLMGGNTQVEGVLLALCLGGLGIGITIWAQRLIPGPLAMEPREDLARPEAVAELDEIIVEEAGFTRRTLLVRALGGALAGLAAALAIPVFSLGPAPGRSLFETSWRAGAPLAPAGGRPLDAESIPLGGVLTVFPAGDAADPNAATLLIRVEPELLQLTGEAATWAPDGFVAYSKICTHAGCPVGLYRAAQHVLICPCHQSEFAVLEGARPISGPAARALPQLPIRRAEDGTFVALGDYPEPVGPSFWNMHL